MTVRFGAVVMPRDQAISGDNQLASRFLKLAQLPALPVVLVSQVHGNKVITIKHKPTEALSVLGEADALAASLPGMVLVIRTGDCVPVALWDEASGVLGVVH